MATKKTTKPAKKTTAKKPAVAAKVTDAVKRTIELILVRPKRSENSRYEFHIHVKENFKTKGYISLGLYSKDGRAEEWCHKDDVEYFKEIRKNEID